MGSQIVYNMIDRQFWMAVEVHFPLPPFGSLAKSWLS